MGSTLLQSMPAELTAGVAARQVKPDRERIRSILNMGSVIELQRQLLTTVMENEVSESQRTPKPIWRFSQVEAVSSAPLCLRGRCFTTSLPALERSIRRRRCNGRIDLWRDL